MTKMSKEQGSKIVMKPKAWNYVLKWYQYSIHMLKILSLNVLKDKIILIFGLALQTLKLEMEI